MTQNIIITGNRHSQKHINIMEMDPYNSKTANLLHEYDGFTKEQFCDCTGYPIELLNLKLQ